MFRLLALGVFSLSSVSKQAQSEKSTPPSWICTGPDMRSANAEREAVRVAGVDERWMGRCTARQSPRRTAIARIDEDSPAWSINAGLVSERADRKFDQEIEPRIARMDNEVNAGSSPFRTLIGLVCTIRAESTNMNNRSTTYRRFNVYARNVEPGGELLLHTLIVERRNEKASYRTCR